MGGKHGIGLPALVNMVLKNELPIIWVFGVIPLSAHRGLGKPTCLLGLGSKHDFSSHIGTGIFFLMAQPSKVCRVLAFQGSILAHELLLAYGNSILLLLLPCTTLPYYYCTMEPQKIILPYYHCCDRCGKTQLVWLLSVSKSRMLGVAGIGLVPISESVKQGPDFAAASDSVDSVISSKSYKTFFKTGTVPRKKHAQQSHHSPCWHIGHMQVV